MSVTAPSRRLSNNRYVDFRVVTEDALVYAAHTMKRELTAEQKQRLLDAYLHLSNSSGTARMWQGPPDVGMLDSVRRQLRC